MGSPESGEVRVHEGGYDSGGHHDHLSNNGTLDLMYGVPD